MTATPSRQWTGANMGMSFIFIRTVFVGLLLAFTPFKTDEGIGDLLKQGRETFPWK